MMFDRDFSFSFYFELLRKYRDCYSLHPLRDFDPSVPRLYLRHDIDVSIAHALKMAEAEAEHGVRSTFMFIPTSPLYKMDWRLRRIAEMGHEVAIHFDYLTSGVDPSSDFSAEVENQCAAITAITGKAVKSISFHRPIPQFLGGPDHLFSRVNAYSKTLMTWYRSDSAGRWRSGNPMDEMPAGIAPQLLTHPIWWDENHAMPGERLKELDVDPDLLTETVPGVQRA